MQGPIEFKAAWLAKRPGNWVEFSKSELQKAPLEKATLSFLTHGFPRSAAPFLSFGWLSYEETFHSISSYYEDLQESIPAQNYWIIGSDAYGDLICIDTSYQDRIVLLDHEQSFELRDVMNENIQDLAACLLSYRNFIEMVLTENGEDAWIERNFTHNQVNQLKKSFESISPNLLKRGAYWQHELDALR